MLASKPCFLHTYSSDTRFIFTVKASLKKLEQNIPKKKLFYFSTATIWAPVLTIRAPKNVESNVFKKQTKFGPRTTPFEPRF